MAGAPVCITSVHLDRSSKSLLKGKPGTIIGWELSEKLPAGDKDVDLKRVPKCVYVQYYEKDDLDIRVPCKWKIGDLSPGVYPVTPITRTWLLGADNKVSRFQLPLIPMYGRTAYSMQGRTLSKGKIDLTMSSPMDPTTGYVAMSRFRSASDVLIMQPFDLRFYQQGPTLEPELFIQYNRMRLVERLDSDTLHALFDNYTTKSERKKRKKAEDAKTYNEHRRINYNPNKRKKAYNGSKSQDPTPNQTPNATPANSPQKRVAPPQADSPSKKTKNVKCNDCGDRIDVCSKSRQSQRNCAAIGKVCRYRW
jgi:hypothetical protein